MKNFAIMLLLAITIHAPFLNAKEVTAYEIYLTVEELTQGKIDEGEFMIGGLFTSNAITHAEKQAFVEMIYENPGKLSPAVERMIGFYAIVKKLDYAEDVFLRATLRLAMEDELYQTKHLCDLPYHELVFGLLITQSKKDAKLQQAALSEALDRAVEWYLDFEDEQLTRCANLTRAEHRALIGNFRELLSSLHCATVQTNSYTYDPPTHTFTLEKTSFKLPPLFMLLNGNKQTPIHAQDIVSGLTLRIDSATHTWCTEEALDDWIENGTLTPIYTDPRTPLQETDMFRKEPDNCGYYNKEFHYPLSDGAKEIVLKWGFLFGFDQYDLTFKYREGDTAALDRIQECMDIFIDSILENQ
ncbi:MAG: hypothetical protein S4CHLAM102_04950 [Chlamydiia bacterium]|nr:hypothetical protein [Chlamydiia bacterium]